MSEAISSQNKPGEASEGEEDDMAHGDLGNGLIRRPSYIYELEAFSSHAGRPRRGSTRKNFSLVMLPNKGEECDTAVFRCSRCNSLNDMSVKKNGINGFSRCSRQNSSDSNSEESNEELKQQLQEAIEEVEILRVDLEASQRQLDGKEQALKILQNLAMLEKATTHTKAIFKKMEQQKRVLEKEINVLQWEIKINQQKFKNTEESWAEKYDRIYCENAALKETLILKTDEIKTLKSENEFLNQQHLEILAMLDVKQQKIVQETMSLTKCGITEITGLELAVLGACTCSGLEGEPCSCARMSAATRKQLLQLKQEKKVNVSFLQMLLNNGILQGEESKFELLKKSKEEAYIMADAFRIAFEQQLMRRKDQALGFAQMNKTCKKEAKLLNWKSLKEDGVSALQGNRKSLGQKVMGMLASGADSKKIKEPDNPQEIIRMLIDLLNDKEEALAHQRKVSYMLARTLEEKENSLQQNKENKCSEELPLKNIRCKTGSESQDLAIPACSCCQTCIAQDSSCSTSSMHIVQHSAGTTESSCFSTPVPVHCTENDMRERKETIQTEDDGLLCGTV